MSFTDMKDIEEIIENDSYKNFVKDLIKEEIYSEIEYNKLYNTLKKKYKICPSKPTLRKIYKILLQNKDIVSNESFLKYSLKKRVKSNSGVNVITIMTSPNPEYTNSKGEIIKQSFSCGQNCSYCPNEPEIRLELTVVDIHYKQNEFKVTTNDSIQYIRILSYIVVDNKQYSVRSCSHFTDKTFIIKMVNKIDYIDIGNTIIGVKIEQPRSYLSTEPAVLRANSNKFDVVLQMNDRCTALENCGHTVDKLEVLVLGGTWDHYPLEYQTEFIRDIFYAVNTLTIDRSERYSLETEIKISEQSSKRLIGLTLETRPDCINLKQIKKLREFNVTRLQIGVQHINDDILTIINRGCFLKDTINGTNLWKRNGGKIDWHLMPDLPGSSLQTDIEMFTKLFAYNSIDKITNNYYKYDLQYPELQSDQLKIYPCSTVEWTKIKEWYDKGYYKPYSEDEEKLIELIIYIKNNVFPWIRINRIIRDIPNINIIGGNKNVNLHQKIINRGDIHSSCIRSREVKTNIKDIDNAELFIREYNGVLSTEYFISYESPDNKILYGFLRLRINHTNDDLIYPELKDCSFIRELHVYGTMVNHNQKQLKNSVQHYGFGKKLMETAEEICIQNNIHKIAVISGVGVRQYYEKLGYKLYNNYMIKTIQHIQNRNYVFEYTLLLTIIILLISILYDSIYDY